MDDMDVGGARVRAPMPSARQLHDLRVRAFRSHLRARGLVDAATLASIEREELATHQRVVRVLLASGVVSPARCADLLARFFGLQRIRDIDGRGDPRLVARMGPDTCRVRSVLPLRSDGGVVDVAIADPTDVELLQLCELLLDSPVRAVVATERDIRTALRADRRDDETHDAVNRLRVAEPMQSASFVLSRPQRVCLAAGAVLVAWAVIAEPHATLVAGSVTIMVVYTVIMLFRMAAVVLSLHGGAVIEVGPRQLRELDETSLPAYTILVPLYREAEVLPRLVHGLQRLEYPASLLDVKLLLEEDDAETINLARSLDLPAYVDIVITPDSQPRTKPKSCNYGLLYARGDYVVIFDAEDVPEADQLRRVVAAFRQLDDPSVACIQARLNYYNRDQNLLARWFTGEYSGWFDLLVPGIDAMRMPFPLGGTSNHFRRDALLEVDAWDPYNVTEDADLGMRLAARGYRSRMLQSTTFEEANSETFNWIRQRSRWVKGYIQTWLVHMRNPIRFARAVGTRNFLGFNLIVGGTAFVFLCNPVLWSLLVLWALTQAHVIRDVFPGYVFYGAWTTFVLGNFAFVYMNLLAVMRRAYWELVPSALLTPIYWALMSIGAWRGLIQLLFAPSYWEKTEHGLDVSPGHLVMETPDDVVRQVAAREQEHAQ